MMPGIAVREMVADWMGASRAYEGFWTDSKDWTWVNDNIPKMNLNPMTIKDIAVIIDEI